MSRLPEREYSVNRLQRDTTMSKDSRIRENSRYGAVADFLKDKIQDRSVLSSPHKFAKIALNYLTNSSIIYHVSKIHW